MALSDEENEKLEQLTARLDDLDSRLRAINSCNCNEDQMKQAINTLQTQLNDALERISVLESDLETALAGEFGGGTLTLMKIKRD